MHPVRKFTPKKKSRFHFPALDLKRKKIESRMKLDLVAQMHRCDCTQTGDSKCDPRVTPMASTVSAHNGRPLRKPFAWRWSRVCLALAPRERQKRRDTPRIGDCSDILPRHARFTGCFFFMHGYQFYNWKKCISAFKITLTALEIQLNWMFSDITVTKHFHQLIYHQQVGYTVS